ncbi:HEAT repeat domain-containing protein [Methylotetracoccus oryzae]|uniref:HEAT repeat domain-containing protein n=1 Tax=Methylotetracoccus oryzae TaxID=1919059 RepID=UPI001118A422|nr:HEAT repeat domain-containing protein [Methylotetracoccus oryzae]
MIRIRRLAVILFVTTLPAWGQDQPRQPWSSPSAKLTLQYDRGQLSANVADATLGQLIEELRRTIPVTIEVVDLGLLSSRITARTTRANTNDALKTLLEGFSYVSYPQHGKTRATIRIVSRAGNGLSIPSAKVANKESGQLQQAAPDPTQEKRNAEKALQRDLDALRTARDDSTRRAAIERLVGNPSALATQALVEQAVGSGSPDFRVGAADALWRHAADREFADPEVLEGLRRLSTDPDRSVSELALRALSDRDAYLAGATATPVGPSTDANRAHQ